MRCLPRKGKRRGGKIKNLLHISFLDCLDVKVSRNMVTGDHRCDMELVFLLSLFLVKELSHQGKSKVPI